MNPDRGTGGAGRVGSHAAVQAPVSRERCGQLERAVLGHGHAGVGDGGGGGRGEDGAVGEHPGQQRSGYSLSLAGQAEVPALVRGQLAETGRLHARSAGPDVQSGEQPVSAHEAGGAADVGASVLELHLLDQQSPVGQDLHALEPRVHRQDGACGHFGPRDGGSGLSLGLAVQPGRALRWERERPNVRVRDRGTRPRNRNPGGGRGRHRCSHVRPAALGIRNSVC